MSLNDLNYRAQKRKLLSHNIHFRKAGSAWYGKVLCHDEHIDFSRGAVRSTTSMQDVTCSECAQIATDELRNKLKVYESHLNALRS